jgi:hypothetical protein
MTFALFTPVMTNASHPVEALLSADAVTCARATRSIF